MVRSIEYHWVNKSTIYLESSYGDRDRLKFGIDEVTEMGSLVGFF